VYEYYKVKIYAIIGLLTLTTLASAYFTGQTANIYALYTEDGIPTSSYANLTLYFPNGSVALNNVGMTAYSTGRFSYPYTFPQTAGGYVAEVSFYNLTWTLRGVAFETYNVQAAGDTPPSPDPQLGGLVDFYLTPSPVVMGSNLSPGMNLSQEVALFNSGNQIEGSFVFETPSIPSTQGPYMSTWGWCRLTDPLQVGVREVIQSDSYHNLSISCNIPSDMLDYIIVYDQPKRLIFVEQLCFSVDGSVISGCTEIHIPLDFVPINQMSASPTMEFLEKWWWIFLLIAGILVLIRYTTAPNEDE
jgi:hypothetical protein